MKNYNFFFINSLFNICHLSTKLRLSENILLTKKKSSRERWTGRQVSGPNMVQNRILCGILCSKFNILNARQRCVICNRIDSKMKGRLRDIEWQLRTCCPRINRKNVFLEKKIRFVTAFDPVKYLIAPYVRTYFFHLSNQYEYHGI